MEIPVINASSEDPDQMSCSVASDLGLHSSPMSLLRDTRHKWMKMNGYTSKGDNSDDLI